jgi:hypothetical protein
LRTQLIALFLSSLETKTHILTLILFLIVSNGFAQFFDREKWQDQRHQLTIGLGASNFLGDLGGKDAIGTNDFQDLELGETRFAAYLGYKYTLYKKLYLRTDFSWGQVSGNDALTQEPYRNNRNLNFRSHIFELAAMIEYELPIRKRRGHIYDIKGAKGWRYQGVSVFVFGGIGAFHYNPKTYFQGQWIPLRPLRTEGQGLPGGAEEYGRFSICFPVGISIMRRISHQVSIGLEASYRFTMTDYIDDVSTNYYNPTDLELYLGGAEGELAAYLSNPSLGLESDGLWQRVTAPGQQRGDPNDDDGYMFLMFRTNIMLEDQYKYRKGKFNPKKGRYRSVQRRGGRTKKIIF